jgi:hypothetical protein
MDMVILIQVMWFRVQRFGLKKANSEYETTLKRHRLLMLKLFVLMSWIKQRTAGYRTATIVFNHCWRNYRTVMSTNHVPGETVKRYYRVDRRKIAILRFIFEAYDGLATIETLNPESGVIVFYIAPGCETDVDMVLTDLKADIMIEAAHY